MSLIYARKTMLQFCLFFTLQEREMRPRREIRTKCNLILLTKGINVNRKKLNKAKQPLTEQRRNCNNRSLILFVDVFSACLKSNSAKCQGSARPLSSSSRTWSSSLNGSNDWDLWSTCYVASTVLNDFFINSLNPHSLNRHDYCVYLTKGQWRMGEMRKFA